MSPIISRGYQKGQGFGPGESDGDSAKAVFRIPRRGTIGVVLVFRNPTLGLATIDTCAVEISGIFGW